MIQLKENEGMHRRKKTLIVGIDGTGKSTLAEKYCERHSLHPVVIDFDDTNYTNLPIADVNLLLRHNLLVDEIQKLIEAIDEDEEFDTLIFDGMGTFLELLTPKTKNTQGHQLYLTRSNNFKKIWEQLFKHSINVIFIGQKDIIVTEENDSSKLSEKINNMVDWKFMCRREGNVFRNECIKWRNQKEEPL